MYVLSIISFLLLGGFLLLAAMRFGVPAMVSDVYYQLQNCTGSEVVTVVHEQIHTKQMQEMLYVFFYLWYVLEWLIRLLVIRNPHKAYRAISFEQEAREYQQYPVYPPNRPHYSWTKYLTKQWNT